MKLLLASHNQAKVNEYKKYLANLNLELLSLSDLKIKQEAPEDGHTFEENAIKKALFYNQLTGLPVITDDSGLTIDALSGDPGVKSRRWLNPKMSDEDIIQTVIEKMKDVPKNKRSSHLVTVACLMTKNGKLYTEKAQVDGEVALEPTPTRLKGFPYRSIIYLPQFKKFYLALTPEEDSQINRRRIVLSKMKPILEKMASE